jgi:multiple sugar transport system permease protein
MESTRRVHPLTTVITYVALAAFVLVALFPFYWMLLTSLRTPKGVYVREGMLMPRNLTLENYRYVFGERPTLRWLRNSVVIGLINGVLSVAIGTLAAYSIARLSYRGNRTIAKGILFTYLMPASLLFIPLFMLMHNIGLYNTLPGLMLSYQTFNVPFCTWLLLGYFRTIPVELEDAARIDGCSRFGVLTRIVVPISAPGIVTAFIFAFTGCWGEFLYATVLISSQNLRTLPTGLGSFIHADVFLWGPLMATAIITTIPPVLLYMFVQKYVVSGMTLGSVKG